MHKNDISVRIIGRYVDITYVHCRKLKYENISSNKLVFTRSIPSFPQQENSFLGKLYEVTK